MNVFTALKGSHFWFLIAIENEKYSLSLNLIDKTYKNTYSYLFKFVLYSIVAFKAN